jgi:hypothetical protein
VLGAGRGRQGLEVLGWVHRAEMLRIAEELTRVDAYPVFVALFVPCCDRRLGAGSRSRGRRTAVIVAKPVARE